MSMPTGHAPTFSRDFVRPLREADHEFLQVLVTRFRVKPHSHGLDLEVGFGPDSPAIWLRSAKRHVLAQLPPPRRTDLQTRLDAFFESGDGEFIHDDPTFPFRLGNGGTLPVVRLAGADYYCLFYRDTHPAGWNIANGGASCLYDLLHPDAIIERELREELFIVEPAARRRYVFEWRDARFREHTDFALAEDQWAERFARMGRGRLEAIPLPLKWVPREDEDGGAGAVPYDSMTVAFGEEREVETGRGLLNINAEDFGIEFDRVAKLAVGPDAVFCDGELLNGRLLDRVVGLFEVENVHTTLGAGAHAFTPDRFYWNGRERTGKDLAAVIDQSLRAHAGRPEVTSEAAVGRHEVQLDLCPVTRNVIRRCTRLAGPSSHGAKEPPPAPFDVFLSFGHQDRHLARQVYDGLSASPGRRVFFSDCTLDHGPFARQIDRALDTASAFVAVASRPEHFERPWVRYEWESFHNDILSGRKKEEDTPFIAFVSGVALRDLPRPFMQREALDAGGGRLEEALARLCALVSTSASRRSRTSE
jgi:hypothetical protein